MEILVSKNGEVNEKADVELVNMSITKCDQQYKLTRNGTTISMASNVSEWDSMREKMEKQKLMESIVDVCQTLQRSTPHSYRVIPDISLNALKRKKHKERKAQWRNHKPTKFNRRPQSQNYKNVIKQPKARGY